MTVSCRFSEFLSPPLALLLVAAVSIVTLPSAAAADVAVTTCGQEVVDDVAVMSGDLDCSSYPGVALILHRSVLRMNGFTITSNLANSDGSSPGQGVPAVECEKTCRILGPGTITGAGGGGLNGAGCCSTAALAGERVTARRLTLEDNGGTGAVARNLKLRSCTIRNNAGYGVLHIYRTTVVDTVIENNGLHGVLGMNAAGSLYLRSSTVSANGAQGVLASNMILRNSTIDGNGTNPAACLGPVVNAEPCVDLYHNSGSIDASGLTCGTSFDLPLDQPTGLCSGD